MCVIIAAIDGVPKKEEIIQAGTFNPDGGGIAWVNKGIVCWEKGRDPDEIAERAEKLTAPYVIHFRLATVGGSCSALTHPFPVTPKVELTLTGEAGRVLFHNGHWSEWRRTVLQTVMTHKKKMPRGDWSDSRAMAWLASVHGRTILNLFQQKVALIDKNGAIETFGTGWIEDGGVWYSNQNHRRLWRGRTVTTQGELILAGKSGTSCGGAKA